MIDYEVRREEGRIGYMPEGFDAEIKFMLYEIDDSKEGELVCTYARVKFDTRWEEWVIHPGSSTNRVTAGEARGRANMLQQAAAECALRNVGITGGTS